MNGIGLIREESKEWYCRLNRNSPSVENVMDGDGESHVSNVGCLWQLVASWNDLFVNHFIPVFSRKSLVTKAFF